MLIIFTQLLFFEYLQYNSLHFSDCQYDGLVCAQLQIPPHRAHLSEEVQGVGRPSVNVESLL